MPFRLVRLANPKRSKLLFSGIVFLLFQNEMSKEHNVSSKCVFFCLFLILSISGCVFALMGSCTLAPVGQLDRGRVRPFKMFDWRVVTEDEHVFSLNREASEWFLRACCLSLCQCERERERNRDWRDRCALTWNCKPIEPRKLLVQDESVTLCFISNKIILNIWLSTLVHLLTVKASTVCVVQFTTSNYVRAT